jgi:hypothetical protein
MPAARRSTTKSTARSGQGVRARAAARSSATRREVEQSIARFEKRLDEANDALKALGGHLGTGARGSYKEVTAALTALRRSASKTNKQALKDFDSLRAALTQKTSAARTNTRKKTSSTAKKTSSTAKKTSSTAKKASSTASKRSTAKRSTAKRSTGSRSTGSRARKSS